MEGGTIAMLLFIVVGMFGGTGLLLGRALKPGKISETEEEE